MPVYTTEDYTTRNRFNPQAYGTTPMFGQQTGASAGTMKTVEGVAGAIPGWGALVQGGTMLSNTSRSANTDAGDFFAGGFAPHTTAFNYWDLAGRKSTSKKDKVKYAFQGIGALLGGAPFMEMGEGHLRRKRQQSEMQAASVADHPFDYMMDKDGINYSQPSLEQQPNYVPPNGAAMAAAYGAGAGIGTAAFSMFGQNKQTEQAPAGDYTQAPSAMSWNTQGFGGTSSPSSTGTDISLGATDGAMDWGDGWNMGYAEGGTLVTGGQQGKDDIALVHAKTGADTGKRVSSGEMLVVSEKNLSALDKALRKGDKAKVFQIMQQQVKEKGEPIKDGEGFKDGGKTKVQSLSEFIATTKPMQSKEGDISIVNNRRFQFTNGSWIDIGAAETFAPANTETRAQKAARLGVREDQLPAEINMQPAFSPMLPAQANLPKLTAKAGAGNGSGSGTGAGAATKTTPRINTADWLRDTKDLVATTQTTQAPLLQAEAIAADLQPRPEVDINQVQVDAFDNQVENRRVSRNKLQDTLMGAAGNAFDVVRFGMGMQGANTEVPEFQKSDDWLNYFGKVRAMSNQGLGAEEQAIYNDNADRAYAYDVENIYNLAGGNAGLALGNLGRANMNRYRSGVNMAAMDRQARMQNLSNYGQATGTDLNIDRMIFGDQYQQAALTKQAGAQLMNDAYGNIQNRFITDRFYGPNSEHAKLQGLQLDQQEEITDIAKAYRDYVKQNGFQSGYGPAQISSPPAQEQTFQVGSQKYKITPYS